MPRMIGTGLSRREREVLEVLYRAESATAAEVAAALPDPPSYSSVRSTLAILEEKGHVRHDQDGKRYVYKPTRAPREAARSALRAVLDTFFGGSMAGAVQTFLSDEEAAGLSPQELEEMTSLLERARAQRSDTQTGEGHDGR